MFDEIIGEVEKLEIQENENGYEKADKSLLNASFFSAESGRTSFGREG